MTCNLAFLMAMTKSMSSTVVPMGNGVFLRVALLAGRILPLIHPLN
jgi:hypothetical protein